MCDVRICSKFIDLYVCPVFPIPLAVDTVFSPLYIIFLFFGFEPLMRKKYNIKHSMFVVSIGQGLVIHRLGLANKIHVNKDTHDHRVKNWCLAQFYVSVSSSQASLVAQLVKNLLVTRETQVPSLGWEDPLEREMATHTNILSWRIPWKEEPGRLLSRGSQSQT